MGLKIALTKGRLENQTLRLLESVDYGVQNALNKGR